MPSITRTIHFAVIVSALILLTAACKKHAGGDSQPGKPSNIYILGTVGDSIVCWKNGVARNIYGPLKSIYEFGSSALSVSGGNEYIAAFQPKNNSFITEPVYWKNGIATVLPDSSGDALANSIFVAGNDVYVAGITGYWRSDTSHVPYTTPDAWYPKSGNVATLWKNGVVATQLPGVGIAGMIPGSMYAVRSYADYISGLFVSGNDVYVSGGSRYAGNNAGYWKNGVFINLSKELTYTAANGRNCYPTTTGIAVSGNDVYVVGRQLTSTNNTVAVYWKNGVPAYLSTDSVSGSAARSIFISGKDVYIAGYQNVNGYGRALYWKNGAPVFFSRGAISATATSIYVDGNDVYAAGYQWVRGGYYFATYWKNGVAVQLTNGSNKDAFASAIYIQ